MIFVYSVIYYVSLVLIVKFFFIVCVYFYVFGCGNINFGYYWNK